MSSFVLATFSLLLFVLNIPGTMALRNVSAVLLLVSLLAIVWKNKTVFNNIFADKQFIQIVLVLLFITLYILIHSIFISHEPSWSLGEFKSHWVYPVLYFVIGILLALSTQLKAWFNKEVLISVLFLSLFAHIFYADFKELEAYMQSGFINHKVGGMIGAELSNYLTNILLGLSVSEWVYRQRFDKRMMFFSNGVLYLFIALLLFSVLIESMRNGIIILVVIGASGAFFLVYQNKNYSKKFKIAISLLVLFLVSLPVAYNLKNDSRWSSLIETVPIAMDTKTHKYWLNKDKYKKPKLANGEVVSTSNYERIAWAYQGAKYVYGSPLSGIGFGRNAFGHAVQNDYKDDSARGKHSHSSIIDFAIAVGIPGLLLWLGFILLILRYGLIMFNTHQSFFAISSFIMTLGFFTRSIVDSNMRDHMFQQFFLILGIMLALLAYEKITQAEES
jgi:O-antigen ligase